jgi:hypothetical protein
VADTINTFWAEHDDFHGKKGKFGNRDHIFKNHVDILGGRSHIWHKKESVRYTVVFGKFAARVCSKILGIGSAERSWGDVKHLKTNKRSHLSGERVKKQATIFGASCMQAAIMKKELPRTYQYDGTWKPIRFWTEDDYNVVYNMEEDGEDDNTVTKPKRTFKAWLEDWEVEAVRKNDPVAENSLLRKYGGLMWKDPDCKDFTKYFLADSNTMKWYRLTKNNGGGWAVIGYDQYYDANATKEEMEAHTEPWAITEDLISCIEEYYTVLNPNTDVRVIKQNNDSDDE